MSYSNIQDEFLSEEDLLRALNIAPEALSALIDDYTIIGCKRNYDIIYPAINLFDGKVNTRVSFLVQMFRSTILEGWEIYRWITEPNDLLEEITPYEYIMLNGLNEKIRLISELKILLEIV